MTTPAAPATDRSGAVAEELAADIDVVVAAHGFPTTRRPVRASGRPARSLIACPPRVVVIALVGLCAVLAAALGGSSSRGVVTHAVSWSASTVGALAWPAFGIVAVCSIVHYLAAAVATRAATGQPLPGGETVLAQLCAAAANKVTPAGLGGSAVLARYLHQRAGLPLATAAGTVSVIALGRAFAALLTLAAVAAGGGWIGLGGGSTELVRLVRQVHASLVTRPWLICVVIGALGAAVAIAIRARTVLKRFATPLRELVHSPRAAATVLAASAAQTMVLGCAFAAATGVLPGGRPDVSTGALIAGYIAAAAAAAAVPLPGGVGSSEAALAAILVSGHVTLGHAAADVLVFRIVTLWLPAVAGLPCLRVLRRRHAL